MTQQQFDIKRYHGGKLALVIVMLVTTFILIVSGLTALTSLVFMWGWGLFVAPVFSVPPLSFPEAFGAIVIGLVLRFILGTRPSIRTTQTGRTLGK